jgi:hypothetical protein
VTPRRFQVSALIGKGVAHLRQFSARARPACADTVNKEVAIDGAVSVLGAEVYAGEVFADSFENKK